jgi:hypothetical protein
MARQQLGKNIIAAMNTPSRIEELLDTSSFLWDLCLIKKNK